MIVLSISKCPPSLRGDLTKWFFEVSTNVFVGIVSARVRDNLWNRIIKNSKTGRAVMVFTTNTEQGFDFRVHNGEWTSVDIDGLKIMKRPLQSNKQKPSAYGYSKASIYRKAKSSKNIKSNKRSIKLFADIIIKIDGEGIRKIMRIEALDVADDVISDKNIWLFSEEVNQDYDESICRKSLTDFLNHISDKKLIIEDSGNALLAMKELCTLLGVKTNITNFENIRSLGKKKLYELRRFDLNSLKQHYGISVECGPYSNCRAMIKIYNELTKPE